MEIHLNTNSFRFARSISGSLRELSWGIYAYKSFANNRTLSFHPRSFKWTLGVFTISLRRWLEEALELLYTFGVRIWDTIPEPMCIIHMHSMLVQKGYIKQQIGLYGTLQDLFSSSLFAGGRIPTSDFLGAFSSACGKDGSPQASFQRRAINRATSRTGGGIHGLLNLKGNCHFKTDSFLRLCQEAEWVPERIPDEE